MSQTAEENEAEMLDAEEVIHDTIIVETYPLVNPKSAPASESNIHEAGNESSLNNTIAKAATLWIRQKNSISANESKSPATQTSERYREAIAKHDETVNQLHEHEMAHDFASKKLNEISNKRASYDAAQRGLMALDPCPEYAAAIAKANEDQSRLLQQKAEIETDREYNRIMIEALEQGLLALDRDLVDVRDEELGKNGKDTALY
ncbi:hypothetical protein IL306_005662 [Fusarium sp. DS 682]|nr:hypothetical protein IL306_005662 [Fusarium sp. DS 682]